MTTSRGPRALLGLLGVLWCCYPLVPAGAPRSGYYDGVAALAIVVALTGVRRLQPPVRRGLLLVVLGFGVWVVGDVVYSVEQDVVHYDGYPAPSDIPYLAAYALIALGLLHLLRGRQNRTDPTPVLDAAIVAVGFGIIVGTFLITPIAEDSGQTVAGRLVASAYPVADVLLLGVLVRLWSTVDAQTTAFRLLLLGLASTMVADITWTVVALSDPGAETPWLDMLWMLGYLATAAAVWSPSAVRLGGGVPIDSGTAPHRRLVALGCGLVLPGLTLLLNGVVGNDVPWRSVAVGSMVMSVLVLLRMGLLVRTVEVQAVQLAALARSDGLTGAPNRRTWDLELGRAFQSAEDGLAPLSVVLIDLDHFKAYNDTHGHQAGDLLLREAVAAWSALLGPDELLARYGGEEFGVLLPGSTVEQAVERVHQMQALTPRGQRFSAGIAAWTSGAEPSAVIEQADRALYDAKHAGRATVRIAHPSHDSPSTPALRIALQPIVDLRTGMTVGHEALCRFADGDPETVFATAHREGRGHALEAAAVQAALQHRPPAGYLSVNVSLEALLSREMRAVLPTDLQGVVLEVTEQTDTDRWDEITSVIAECRQRGASIAVDDWGRGYSTMDRIMRLRPELIKLDRSLLHDLGDTSRQQAVRAVVAWARSLGALTCAEGVEDPEDLDTLRELAIDSGQGYFFGRPQIAGATPDPADTALEPTPTVH